MELLTLALAFVVILAGAELFTNGIEWFGHKLGLAEGAVGSVLAAVGTALPETMIPIIAILFSAGATSSEVGVGAILGAPFMLATLAMFVTGVAVLAVARHRASGDVMRVDTTVLAHDMRFFAIAYAMVPFGQWTARGMSRIAGPLRDYVLFQAASRCLARNGYRKNLHTHFARTGIGTSTTRTRSGRKTFWAWAPPRTAFSEPIAIGIPS